MSLTNEIKVGSEYKIVNGSYSDLDNAVKVISADSQFVSAKCKDGGIITLTVPDFKQNAVLIENIPTGAPKTKTTKPEPTQLKSVLQEKRKAKKTKKPIKKIKHEFEKRKFNFTNNKNRTFIVEYVHGKKQKRVVYTDLENGTRDTMALSIFERRVKFHDETKTPIIEDTPEIKKMAENLEEIKTIQETNKPTIETSSDRVLIRAVINGGYTIDTPTKESEATIKIALNEFLFFCPKTSDGIAKAIKNLIDTQGIDCIENTIEFRKYHTNPVIID